MRKRMLLEEERPKILRVLEVLSQAAIAAVLGLFAALFLFRSAKTASRSMEPSIEPDSVVFINRIVYSLKEPERFDVIAFERRTNEADVLIRRVVGLPGETIRIFRGVITIDGEEIDGSEWFSEITSDGIAENGIRLEEGEYFVLGDTPANSEDSRSSTVGVVYRQQIIGRVWIAFRSITEFKLIRRAGK